MPKHRLDDPTPTGAEAGTDHGTQQGTQPLDEVSGQDAHVGDAPNPLERGRSENPPPDGVGYDGASVDEIQQDRAERLAAENRPPNTEVDNTGREFDVEKAMFTDEPGHDDAPKVFPPADEQGA